MEKVFLPSQHQIFDSQYINGKYIKYSTAMSRADVSEVS
jgi:hypothetical protein